MAFFSNQYFSLDNFKGFKLINFIAIVVAFMLFQPGWAEAQFIPFEEFTPDENNILYVDKNITGGDGSGNSWGNAIPELRDALTWARSHWNGFDDGPLQVWVAEGTYLPTDSDANRQSSFRLGEYMEVYGGFAGGESNLNARNWQTNETILSGDIDGNDLPFDPLTDSDSDGSTPSQTDHIVGGNSYTVVYLEQPYTDNRIRLDGFIVTGGVAEGETSFDYRSEEYGGGIFIDDGSTWLENIIVRGNIAETGGGGIFTKSPDVTIANIQIEDNTSRRDGGGIFSYLETSGTLVLESIVINRNESENEGGGLYIESPVTMINSLVTENRSQNGGGLYAGSGNIDIINTTFTKNAASSLGGAVVAGSTNAEVDLRNVIIWDNEENGNTDILTASIYDDEETVRIYNSLIANSGGSFNWNLPSEHFGFNLDADPLFANPDNGDYSLSEMSPALNRGDNTPFESGGEAEGITVDLASNLRIYDGDPASDIVDMGAYEFQREPFYSSPEGNNIFYVNKSVSGGNQSGDSWTNAVPELRDVLNWAGENWDGDADGTLQIWVASGTYLPTDDGTDRRASFTLVDHVEVYGGFVGDETELNQRDWQTNVTILSGDIGGDDDQEIITDPITQIIGGNSHHVVDGSRRGNTAILDGFIITAGLTEGTTYPEDVGAGIFIDSGDPVLTNLEITGNQGTVGGGVFLMDSSPSFENIELKYNHADDFGGGLYIFSDSNPRLNQVNITDNRAVARGGGISSVGSTPVLNQVTISGNRAGKGGGMFNRNNNPILTNVVISDNTADAGGGMYNFISSDPKLVNVIFSDNTAETGAGIQNDGSSPNLTNVTMIGNRAGNRGGGMYNLESDDGRVANPILKNVVFWDNQENEETNTVSASIYNDLATPVISHSLVANSGGSGSWNDAMGTDGGNNLDLSPVFADPENGDYSLSEKSPAINSGDNTPFASGGIAEDVSTDLAGNPRIYDGSPDPDLVDMGAYEFQGEPFSLTPDGNNILYVDQNVDTGVAGYEGRGDSWDDAIPELRDALSWAADNWDGSTEGTLQIWVADGKYTPTEETDQNISFQLLSHVEIYGGFAGGENSLSVRDWETNKTILSGDIDNNDDVEIITDPARQFQGNNSFHVVNGSNTDDTSILDGFTITAGRALGSGNDEDGAGIYSESGNSILRNLVITGTFAGRFGGAISNRENSNPVITNVVIHNNLASDGAGMYNNDSSPILRDVIIQENRSSGSGGGMYSQNGSSPVLTNVKVLGNTARSGFNVGRFGGGGLYFGGGNPILTNVLLSGNVAEENFDRSGGLGGAILNVGSSPVLTNVTVTGNVSDNGGAIYNSSSGSNVDIRNSIIWNNQDDTDVGTASSSIVNTNSATTTISYSMVQGQNPSGDGNLDGTDSNNAPMFVTSVNPSDAPTVAGNFQLQEGSPGISIGNNVVYEAGQNPDLSEINTDLDGNIRIKNARVDMGAYEFQGDEKLLITPDENNIVYVDQNVSGGVGSGDSWSNAIKQLRDALNWAANNWDGDTDGTLQIWVAEGTYLPTDDGTDREASFTLVDQVEIYGGFAGNESNLEERDPQANETILSGDIDQNDLAFEPQTDSDGDPSTPTQIDHIVGGNSYSVVYLKEDGVTVHLNGFTVTGGLADSDSSSGLVESDSGGGIFIDSDGGNVTMNTLTVKGNYGLDEGGGMFLRSGGRFSDTLFEYNVAEDGGGIWAFPSTQEPLYENLIFRANHALNAGGGMFSGNFSTMVNSLFVENSARVAGGLLVARENMTIIGSTFTRNSAEEVAGAIRTALRASLINVIIWDNELGGNKDIPEASFSSEINIDISSSIIANSGGSANWRVSEYADDGGGNLDVDPIFADPENGDYSLSISSPAINRGDNTPFTSGGDAEGVTTDLAGNPRIYDGDPDPDVVDMGAYEFQDEPFGYPFLISPSNFETRVAVSPTFQWEEASLAEAYDLQLSLSPDFSNPVIDQNGLATNEYSPSDELRYGVTYYWRVRGTSSTLNGAWSSGQFQTTISNAGDGSEAAPWEVATADQLNAVRADRDGFFIQTADIDLTEVTREGGSYWNDGLGWEPIGKTGESFLGNYNGNGHVITGMYINRPDRERTGLFGSVSTATIRGVGIVEPEITGGNATGGLAGLINDGIISESYVSGGSVTGDNQTGGLVGVTTNTNTLIENVYAGTNVTGQDGVGGLIGDVTGTLNNVYSFSYVSGTSNNGALIGTGSPSGNSEWYYSTETGANDNGTGTGLDGDQMRQQASFSGFDFSNMWQIQSADFTSYPYLRLFTYDEPLAEPAVNPIPGLFIDDTAVVLLSSPADNSENISLTPLFEWDPADVADSYDLLVSPSSDFSDPVIDETGITESEFQTVDDLSFSTTYYWRARSVNAGGPGEWSEAFSFTTIPEVPAAIVLTSPADEDVNIGLSPEFTWETDEGADTYEIQVSENSDLSTPVVDESGLENPTFSPASDLANAAVYYWRVRGVNAGGEGVWSEVFSFTTLPESSEVVILIAPADGAEDVSRKPLFEWNAADGAVSYDLVVSPNSDFSDPVIDEGGITKTEFQTADELILSTTYNWRARGRNAAGPGEWSESFSFTTRDQPEAADRRILVANNDSYTFTPADFGQSDNSHMVIIEDLLAGFRGSLELDGSDVAADDEISVLDIESGDLTYSPPQGSYGYNFDRFDFSIADDEGNPSEDAYRLTIDLAATSVELVGAEGWRFLASPVNGETAGGFFEPIWTQGFEGSDSPGAQFANVQTLNQAEYKWEPVKSSEFEFNAGDPFIVYVYGDDNNGTPPESGFPKTLFSSNENWVNLDGNYQQVLEYDGDQQESDDSFYLWGNPYPLALDLCEAGFENIAKNAYFWDPSQNDGNGDYINLSCDAGDGVEIAPYQSVWFRVTDEANRLELPDATFMEDQTKGYFKQNDAKDLFLITLNVESRNTEKSYSGLTRILFDEDANQGADLLDAPKFHASGFANRYLSLYSLDADMNPYDLQALPSEIDQKLRIPLDIATTEAGEYTMQWTLPGPHVFSGRVYLRDHQTDEVMELKQGDSYRIEVAATHSSSDHPQGTGESVQWADPVGDDPRFELLIAASGVDGLSELGDVPTDFTLAQNYPNPFNPTTQISYQLPVDSRVSIAVFDMLGRQVATLVDEQMAAGRHSVTFDAGNLSSGIYLYRLQAGNTVMTRKLTIMK